MSVLMCSAVVLLAASACREQIPERKYIAVKVRATNIDVDSGIVTVEWTDPRSGQTNQRSGKVTSATEIFINGISAGIENVRVGDQATVTVYPTVSDGEEQWIVTRVSVEREDSFMLTKPAPKSAEKSAEVSDDDAE